MRATNVERERYLLPEEVLVADQPEYETGTG